MNIACMVYFCPVFSMFFVTDIILFNVLLSYDSHEGLFPIKRMRVIW